MNMNDLFRLTSADLVLLNGEKRFVQSCVECDFDCVALNLKMYVNGFVTWFLFYKAVKSQKHL